MSANLKREQFSFSRGNVNAINRKHEKYYLCEHSDASAHDLPNLTCYVDVCVWFDVCVCVLCIDWNADQPFIFHGIEMMYTLRRERKNPEEPGDLLAFSPHHYSRRFIDLPIAINSDMFWHNCFFIFNFNLWWYLKRLSSVVSMAFLAIAIFSIAFEDSEHFFSLIISNTFRKNVLWNIKRRKKIGKDIFP